MILVTGATGDSAIGVSPTSDINLARWHWRSEKYIEESGIGFTHVRPTFFMQNFLEMADMINRQNRIVAFACDYADAFRREQKAA